jgi:hypothetical protein
MIQEFGKASLAHAGTWSNIGVRILGVSRHRSSPRPDAGRGPVALDRNDRFLS